jgi:hypothetical protein
MVRFTFEAKVVYWRGPPPFFLAPVPPRYCEDIRRLSTLVTYGWGMIPSRRRDVGLVAPQHGVRSQRPSLADAFRCLPT